MLFAFLRLLPPLSFTTVRLWRKHRFIFTNLCKWGVVNSPNLVLKFWTPHCFPLLRITQLVILLLVRWRKSKPVLCFRRPRNLGYLLQLLYFMCRQSKRILLEHTAIQVTVKRLLIPGIESVSRLLLLLIAFNWILLKKMIFAQERFVSPILLLLALNETVLPWTFFQVSEIMKMFVQRILKLLLLTSSITGGDWHFSCSITCITNWICRITFVTVRILYYSDLAVWFSQVRVWTLKLFNVRSLHSIIQTVNKIFFLLSHNNLIFWRSYILLDFYFVFEVNFSLKVVIGLTSSKFWESWIAGPRFWSGKRPWHSWWLATRNLQRISLILIFKVFI